MRIFVEFAVVFLLLALRDLIIAQSQKRLPQSEQDGRSILSLLALISLVGCIASAVIKSMHPTFTFQPDNAHLWSPLEIGKLVLALATWMPAVFYFLIWFVLSLDTHPYVIELVRNPKRLPYDKILRGWLVSFGKVFFFEAYDGNTPFYRLARSLGLEYFVNGFVLKRLEKKTDGGDPVRATLVITAGPKASPAQFARWVYWVVGQVNQSLEAIAKEGKGAAPRLSVCKMNLGCLDPDYITAEIQSATIAIPEPLGIENWPIEGGEPLTAEQLEKLPPMRLQ